MGQIDVASFSQGKWIAPGEGASTLCDAATGEPVARGGGCEINLKEMRAHAIDDGGRALRSMTFHERALMIKALAQYLDERKEQLYELSYLTGATLGDSRVDIDGGIGTLFVFSSKARRELPDSTILLDGDVEKLSKGGSFIGQHICTSLQGVAVHINAFNFPVWGMLEKLAPTLLAGMPAIIKPATATSYLAEAAFRMIIESGLLPTGAVQLVCGKLASKKEGPMLFLLGPQDVISFTGSSSTSRTLRSNGNVAKYSIRFTAEQDSLNASILGPDISVDDAEFQLLVKEVCREMTVKAGQKCTAIRRIMVPDAMRGAVAEALVAALEKVVVGDPRRQDVGMGALVNTAQQKDVLAKCAKFDNEARRITGGAAGNLAGGLAGEKAGGLAGETTLFDCAEPDHARQIHSLEAFGPVASLMGYRDLGHAAALANRGGGALVTSVITRDVAVARELVENSASLHGRLYFNNADSMKEATGHGSPLPHMIHGGPGRAGGSQELGGMRALAHYMQRTALQGPPSLLSGVCGSWLPGSATHEGEHHPFTRKFDELVPGLRMMAGPRRITGEDIARFAETTGDRFYAHTDEAAAAANPFFDGIVAHGYLLLSYAAGLFVDPAPGPVLANTGLERLRFVKPAPPDTQISVELVVKQKTRRTDEFGEVRWQVAITDETGDTLASYELLTMVAC